MVPEFRHKCAGNSEFTFNKHSPTANWTERTRKLGEMVNITRLYKINLDCWNEQKQQFCCYCCCIAFNLPPCSSNSSHGYNFKSSSKRTKEEIFIQINIQSLALMDVPVRSYIDGSTRNSSEKTYIYSMNNNHLGIISRW